MIFPYPPTTEELDFLWALVLSIKPRFSLETGSGASTLVIAEAFQDINDGLKYEFREVRKLISLDIDQGAIESTRYQLKQAGLTHWVDLQKADAHDRDFSQHLFDFVFIDDGPTLADRTKTFWNLHVQHVFAPKATVLVHDALLAENNRESYRQWEAIADNLGLRGCVVPTQLGFWLMRM